MLTPTIELIIRDTLAMMPYFIAIEGTPEFAAISAFGLGCRDNEELLASFQLTEVMLPDGKLADAIVVSELPAAACATL